MPDQIVWAPLPHLPAPRVDISLLNRLRAQFFPNLAQSVVSIAVLLTMVWLLPLAFDWAIASAVWSKADPSLCAAPDAGACWAVITEKHRVMLFGAFPYSEHWRAGLASLFIILGASASAMPRFWSIRLLPMLGVITILVLWLMLGGFGLSTLSTSDWGGLQGNRLNVIVG